MEHSTIRIEHTEYQPGRNTMSPTIIVTPDTTERPSAPDAETSRIHLIDSIIPGDETITPTLQSLYDSTTPSSPIFEMEGSAGRHFELLEAHLGAPPTTFDAIESIASSSSGPNTPLQGLPQKKNKEHLSDGSADEKRLPLDRSLGMLSCAIIFGGSALNILAVGFLLFLWLGAGPVKGGTKASELWRAIMLHGWATQSVTLTSLLIRTISGAQAGLCTSMVAALLLERRGVPVSKMAQLSVARSVKTDPIEFLYTIRSRKTRKAALALETFLLFLLALTALGIQFSTTILVSDFGSTGLVQSSNRTIINVGMSRKGGRNIGSFLTFGNLDSSTVLFGEVETQSVPAPNELGVSDIGTKRRAFLPFQKEERIDLQQYSGAAFSLVSRAVCMRPSMSAKLVFDPKYLLSLNGVIDFNQSLIDAGHGRTQRCYTTSAGNEFCLPENFNCSLPVSNDPLFNDSSSWPTAICHLPINDDPDKPILPTWNQHSSPFDFTTGSWAHLVFATNLDESYWDQLERSGPVALGDNTTHGEWVSNELQPGRFLNTTLCFTVLNTTISSVNMTGSINQSEPNLLWNTSTASFEIQPLKNLFAPDDMHKTPSQRGIFTIANDIQDPAPLSAFHVNNTMAIGAIQESSSMLSWGSVIGVWEKTGGGASVGMCNHCSLYSNSVSDDISALFQYIINTTGRSAIAVDAYLAMLSRSWFYYLLPKLDVPGYVEMASVVQVLLPLRWGGLTAVLVLVGTNMILMGIVSVLYIQRTRFSFAGDYWHAVSQLISRDTMSLLEKSGEMKDDDVEEKLDMDHEDFLVKVERSSQDGFVTVVKA